MKKRILSFLLAVASAATLMAGPALGAGERVGEKAGESSGVELADELVALAAAPALPDLLLPEASGTKTAQNAKAVIDYSNISDGYVMVKFTAQSDRRLKAKVTGPSGDYQQYDLTQGEWEVLPLSDGSGSYKVSVLQKKNDDPKNTKYATALSVTFSAELTDEFAPYIRPNQYVDYGGAEKTLAKAAELVGKETDALKKVEAIYDFVVSNLTYDKEKAATVQSGYLPVLDQVLEAKTGICFDYAALMAGMLRSQGVPCKLVVGYAGTAYHAWISVWSEKDGWVEGVIYFDGKVWKRMDPTFASSLNNSEAILNYIGDGKNYTEKYLY